MEIVLPNKLDVPEYAHASPRETRQWRQPRNPTRVRVDISLLHDESIIPGKKLAMPLMSYSFMDRASRRTMQSHQARHALVPLSDHCAEQGRHVAL